MTLAEERIEVDRDAVSPDLITATVTHLVEELHRKADAAGVALDWGSTRVEFSEVAINNDAVEVVVTTRTFADLSEDRCSRAATSLTRW